MVVVVDVDCDRVLLERVDGMEQRPTRGCEEPHSATRY